jgi:salicylate hydroxylase
LASAGPGNWREAQEADGPAAQARNARLGARDSVLNHLNWIHDFDALTEEPSERQGGTWL